MSISHRNHAARWDAAPRFISGSSSPPEHAASPPSFGATTTEPGRQREVCVVHESSSAGVSSGTRRQSCERLCARRWRDKEGKRVRGRQSERQRDFSPPLGKTNPPPAGYRGAGGGGGGVEETRGGLRGRRKEGARRVTQGGLGGGWGRQPQKYTATTPRGSTAEAAIFHRRTETRPRELNTLSYFLRVEAVLPPAEATARWRIIVAATTADCDGEGHPGHPARSSRRKNFGSVLMCANENAPRIVILASIVASWSLFDSVFEDLLIIIRLSVDMFLWLIKISIGEGATRDRCCARFSHKFDDTSRCERRVQKRIVYLKRETFPGI